MSVARFALRYAAVRALKGATLVADNVQDSKIGAVDIAADGTIRGMSDRAFIAIYTDEGIAEGEGLALRSLRENGRIDFVLEIGVTAAMTVIDPETGVSETHAGIPATDEGLEATLDIVERQATIALSDPTSTWAELWRKLHDNVVRIERRRASGATGTRMAARQTRLTLDTKPDPVPGQPLAESSVWVAFRTALEADAGADSDVVAIFDALIGEPGDMTVDRLRQMRGNTEDEAAALRITEPLFATPISSFRFEKES